VAEDQLPFADLRATPEGHLSLPDLKWRELVFIGALRCRGGLWERDPDRPMPPFVGSEPFPPGSRFELLGRRDGRALLRRLSPGGAG
jgi:hypothetical protein